MGRFTDPNVIYGLGAGDAGVYKIAGNLALVQTVDLFTPIVDDPYTYGWIAAVNALSDIYAMGAKPVTALNILACSLPPAITREILRGGADAAREAGVAIIGGHSLSDDEPKYGLAVTGLVDPARMVTNLGAMPGDALILTKKIGVGIINAMGKRDHVFPPETIAESVAGMKRPNREASIAMLEAGARACTDISGFGLLGHALNMAPERRLVIEYGAVPKYAGVEKFALEGTKGGAERNYRGVKDSLELAAGVTLEQVMILCDPQTSGGLLMAVPQEKAEGLIRRLRDGGDSSSAIIGHVAGGPVGTIEVRP